MNISESFANYLETITGSTLGQDLYIGNAPSSNKTQDAIWWLVATGGDRTTDAVTGESLKAYTIEIFRRSRDYKSVYEALQGLEIILNCSSCVVLEDFQTVSIKASVLGVDDDLDNEDRKVGLLQVDITVYENC